MNKELVLKIAIVVILIAVFSVGSYFAYTYFTKEDEIEYKTYKIAEMPRVDASLATQPLMTTLVKEFTKKSEVNIEYTDTRSAYTKLIDNEIDLIIASEPSEEEIAYAQEQGVDLEITKVVNEAFVFFVNKNNPITNLTISQIQDIYSGKTTNWSVLGGNDEIIKAYQSPTNSISQEGMLSFVMKDVDIRQPIKEEFIEAKAGTIEVIADYDNGISSIGYAYYYYANTIYQNIKLMKINGIEPTYETIRNETYPFMSAYYIVIRKSEKNDSITRQIVDEILSERGQLITKNAGYIPVKK